MFHELVIFGASGDLTARKLIPALFRLYCQARLPEPFAIVGVSRTEMTSEQWREKLARSTVGDVADERVRKFWNDFARSIYYFPGNIEFPQMYPELERFLAKKVPVSRSEGINRVFYLAVSPSLYAEVVRRLGQFGMTRELGNERRAIIVEKPFGRDLKTARDLNRAMHEVFAEERIFRIDHYLGKETVNNIFALRFANTIFEPLWNRNYIEHVQITANESNRVGRRGAFYETTGVLRDMFQNHLLQLLAITAMEPPVRFDAQAVRDEKVKVLRAIRRMSVDEAKSAVVFGQYAGYNEEPGTHPDSLVPTFAALKLYIDNWRWKDVPFYLRSGKATSCQTTQIVIMYRLPPHSIFGPGFPDYATCVNRLLIQIQPSEGIHLSFLSKVPGTEMKLRTSELSFSFKEHVQGRLPEAYERLLLDAMNGDASLFARNDEVENAWDIIDPIRRAQEELVRSDGRIAGYEPGSWGPDLSNEWMNSQGRHWFDLCPVL